VDRFTGIAFGEPLSCLVRPDTAMDSDESRGCELIAAAHRGIARAIRRPCPQKPNRPSPTRPPRRFWALDVVQAAVRAGRSARSEFGVLSAYKVLTRLPATIREIAEVAGNTGGSDGTRTRGLCRDRAAL